MRQPREHRQPRRSRQQWLDIVQHHDQSGLTAKAFCDEQGLSYASFIKWRSELSGESRQGLGSFVELTANEHANDCLVELTIGHSVILRIRSV